MANSSLLISRGQPGSFSFGRFCGAGSRTPLSVMCATPLRDVDSYPLLVLVWAGFWIPVASYREAGGDFSSCGRDGHFNITLTGL